MRRSARIFLCVLCVFFVFLGCIGWMCFGSITKTSLKYYEEFISSELTPMPSLDSLQNYEKINFEFFHRNMLLFNLDVYTLFVKYDNSNYQQEKENLKKRYLFETEPIFDRKSGSKSPTFSLDSFYFRVLDMDAYYDEYNLLYPNSMCFIGTSDKTHEIVFIHYLDKDLDYLEGSLPDFLKKECNWK